MHELGWKNYIAAAGIDQGTWKNLAHRTKGVAYAFGEAVADMPKGRYFDIDSVALRLGLDLAETLGGRSSPGNPRGQVLAGGLLRLNTHVVLKAIARADHEREPVFFAVAEFEKRKRYACFDVTLPQFADITGVGEEPPTVLHFVNLTAVLAKVRANAAAAGLDLSDPFLPAPDTELFEQLVQAGRKMDHDLLAKVHADLKRKGVPLKEARA